jgi:hypothetical protein
MANDSHFIMIGGIMADDVHRATTLDAILVAGCIKLIKFMKLI